MAFAANQNLPYDFLPAYDDAIESVADKMTVDLALHPDHGERGDWVGIHAGETVADLSPFTRAISSVRIFTDDNAADRGRLRLHQPPTASTIAP